jgi:hypothetical protein
MAICRLADVNQVIDAAISYQKWVERLGRNHQYSGDRSSTIIAIFSC